MKTTIETMETAIKINNKLTKTLKIKNKILSVYFTAGYPELYDTSRLVLTLQEAGVDMIEIGIPYSDSLLDGPIIQESNNRALNNGMTLKLLFKELLKIKDQVRIPLVLMGSYNSAIRFGMEAFCKACKECEIDGVLFPEMPPEELLEDYAEIYEENNLSSIFMISPQTSKERLKFIDKVTTGFIYVLSSNSTTGSNDKTAFRNSYFEKIRDEKLQTPTMIGFNIRTKENFDMACKYTRGAIIGSEFIRLISNGIEKDQIKNFIDTYKKSE
ncbi:MAG: tryptophan synthase subunit alpha [Sporocytophaga sp.]|uniref:tryptophan synthase subunit alpha n=1 Tax=Sporocytophaga sp. TaxID=2231183 RepID=UPI001B2B3F71|nr:tryptophan synthase subunit alpha [Sporocytophaga sp.]MBO9702785.1 tryptophan synthase subunit alpha [Sporocytophaga sp.]